MNLIMNWINAPAEDRFVNDKFLLLILITFTLYTCSLNSASSARYFQSVCRSRRANRNLAATLLPSAPAPRQTHPLHSGDKPSFLCSLHESEDCVRESVVAQNDTILTTVCKKFESKH